MVQKIITATILLMYAKDEDGSRNWAFDVGRLDIQSEIAYAHRL